MARLEFEQDPVHVKTAAVVGVTERTLNQKRFLFQIDLEWSDGNKTSSFRSYSDFFDFQCGLLTTFPREGGLEKGHERIIPFLPGKKWFSRSTRQLAEQRLPEIREYVQRLIALPQHISKSEDVVSFFRSNWQEDRLRRGEGRGSLLRNGSSTSNKYTVENLSKSRVRDETNGDEFGMRWSELAEVEGSEEVPSRAIISEPPTGDHSSASQKGTPKDDKNITQQEHTATPPAEDSQERSEPILTSDTGPGLGSDGEGQSETVDMQQWGQSEQ